jgi:hypothetical protein
MRLPFGSAARIASTPPQTADEFGSGDRHVQAATHLVRRDDERRAIRSLDPLASNDADYGRAEMAFKEEFDRWQGLIDTAAHDLSMPQYRRMAAVTALRAQQRAAAFAARQRAVKEEQQTVKAARRAARRFERAPC